MGITKELQKLNKRILQIAANTLFVISVLLIVIFWFCELSIIIFVIPITIGIYLHLIAERNTNGIILFGVLYTALFTYIVFLWGDFHRENSQLLCDGLEVKGEVTGITYMSIGRSRKAIYPIIYYDFFTADNQSVSGKREKSRSLPLYRNGDSVCVVYSQSNINISNILRNKEAIEEWRDSNSIISFWNNSVYTRIAVRINILFLFILLILLFLTRRKKNEI
ncbi:MAG: hypothetical protein E6767_11335 [Dysgonomonas sp.]|nr:hypothetical protein [Dysgonomonas sp.]